MAFDLDERHFVLLSQLQECFPQVLIFDRLLASRFPSPFDPIINPAFIEGIGDVCAVGVYSNSAGLFQDLERLYDSRQLHAVIRGLWFCSGNDTFVAVEHQQAGPASGTRVAAAGTIGIQSYFLARHVSIGLKREIRRQDTTLDPCCSRRIDAEADPSGEE